ncbi:MAG: hypothetical protein IIU93_02635, partial [Alistipes sp.]|nr:hypothetical protein [Alistipes sp.]
MFMLISVLFPILSGLVLLLSKTDDRAFRERWVIGTAVITAALGIGAAVGGYGAQLELVRFTKNLALMFR